MKNEITCRDTDDAAYWAKRIRAGTRAECESMIIAMMRLAGSLERKGIPAPGANARIDEAEALYAKRFGFEFVPF